MNVLSPPDAGPDAPTEDPLPLVTIGIPAYNRPKSLEQAVHSALAQTHSELEVLISDDASPDPEMRRMLARLSASDGRVRVVRQPVNLGHAGNYQAVLDAARGEYFMWLADDDWIEPSYVGACLSALRADSRLRLACGTVSYRGPDHHEFHERPLSLCSARPGRRVLGYYAGVSTNGALFGLARREVLDAVGFPDEVGGDWLLVAAILASGRVVTVPGVRLHRSSSGLGSDPAQLTRSFGLTGLRARRHHLFLAGRVGREIVSAPAFDALGPVARLFVGGGAAMAILVRFVLADLVREAIGERRAGWLEAWVSARLSARSAM